MLGTEIGSQAADGSAIISREAYLDIVQESEQPVTKAHRLRLQVAPNDATMTQGIQSDITDEFAVQTIYLGHGSNISLGSNGDVALDKTCSITFPLTTNPTLFIDGNFFSFETRGGYSGVPEDALLTGQGAIFVDAQGRFEIAPNMRASCGVVVARRRFPDGGVNLPVNQIRFDDRVGIAVWNVDLSDAEKRILIRPQEHISDFTLDWSAVIKEFQAGGFVPYELTDVSHRFSCKQVTHANLQSLPVVQGTVNQLQIRRSRYGDQVHLLIDGGRVKELIFLDSSDSAVAPVGFIALDHGGSLGLGPAHRDRDSLNASVVMGLNGVTIAANGDCIVELNENVLINNICPLLAGPDFGLRGEQRLIIRSNVDHEIRVASEGVLDLCSFTNKNQIVEFAGNVKLVFEPGAILVLGGGTLVFTDEAQIVLN